GAPEAAAQVGAVVGQRAAVEGDKPGTVDENGPAAGRTALEGETAAAGAAGGLVARERAVGEGDVPVGVDGAAGPQPARRPVLRAAPARRMAAGGAAVHPTNPRVVEATAAPVAAARVALGMVVVQGTVRDRHRGDAGDGAAGRAAVVGERAGVDGEGGREIG